MGLGNASLISLKPKEEPARQRIELHLLNQPLLGELPPK